MFSDHTTQLAVVGKKSIRKALFVLLLSHQLEYCAMTAALG